MLVGSVTMPLGSKLPGATTRLSYLPVFKMVALPFSCMTIRLFGVSQPPLTGLFLCFFRISNSHIQSFPAGQKIGRFPLTTY